ncbi:MAG: GldG family protein [Oscillibacter sp.]|jgi:ABC-2 type transport system permease protein|nr:GldG family protein [Oscillibacter sp.]
MSFFHKKTADGASQRHPAPVSRRASRAGTFSAGLTALVIAAVVVFNLLMAQLPDTATQFDLTDSRIYRISDTSVDYLGKIQDDVEIHVLADKSSVDTRIVRFLSKYEDLSPHLKVEYLNPTVHPSVLNKYNCEAGTIAVTCEKTGRQETVPISSIIGIDQMAYYYYGTKTETSFDAEGLLTSAVDGVLNSTSRTLYATQGHEETAISADVTALFKKSHVTLSDVNLLTAGGIPDDCSLLVLNAPVKDLADDELTMIEAYLSQGGQVIYCMSSKDGDRPNLEKLCASYGMDVAPGIIEDPQHCYQNNPFLFFPTVNTQADAASGLADDATLLFYGSRGMTIGKPARDTVTVTSILDTSSGSYAVVDENNAVQGTYSVGALATEKISDTVTARFTVYGADSLINQDLLGSFTNLDNAKLFISSATCGFSDVSNLSIDPVSLAAPTNTISTGGIWALLFIFVLPLAALITGFVRWMRRRRL